MNLKRTILWGSIACLLLVAALAGYAYFFLDEPPPADEDLKFTPEEVPEAENGFHLLHLKRHDVEMPRKRDQELEPFGERWDGALARQVLEQNAEVLQAFEESAARPSFKVPANTEPGHGNAWREIARLLGMRLCIRFEEGKEREAFEGAMEILRFSNRIERSEGFQIHHIVGWTIRSEACRHLRRLMVRTTLTQDHLRGSRDSSEPTFRIPGEEGSR